MILENFPSNLITQLKSKYNVGVYLDNYNLKIKLPFKANEAPPEAVSLLRQLKEYEGEVLFSLVLARLNSRHGPEDTEGLTKWARDNAPALLKKTDDAEDEVNATKKDKEAFQAALKAYERAIDELAVAYNSRKLSVDEAIKIFEPIKTWQLSPEKAQILNKAFSCQGDIEAGGYIWKGVVK